MPMAACVRNLLYYLELFSHIYKCWVSFSNWGEVQYNEMRIMYNIALCMSSAAIRIHHWYHRL